MNMKHKGFTIVELLIVIVVIGILAAISIVAYNGVTSRASDTTVKSDLSNIAKKIDIFKIEAGSAPAATIAGMGQLGVKPSYGSYGPGHIDSGGGKYNLLYCVAENNSDFSLLAWSKSNKAFVYKEGSISEFTDAPGTRAVLCPKTGIDYSSSRSIWVQANNVWRM